MSRAQAGSRWPTLVLVCVAQFMVILDVSVVNVALPSIRTDLGFSATGLQWVVNAYTLTFAGLLLLGGRATDLLERRRVFIAGLLLFAGASLAGGLAQSEGWLVAARAAQGLGGAVISPATLAIIATTFTEGSERNRALGAWGAMGGAGGTAGVLLGGVLTQALGWQWVLFINVPIGLAAALLAMRYVPAGRHERSRTRNFDVSGALLGTLALVTIVFAIVRTDVNGWGSPATLSVLGAGLALLVGFLLVEGRIAKAPLMPLRIFRSRVLSSANVVVFMLGAAMFSMWYFVSLYLQQVLGYEPLEAGLAFLPMTLTIIVSSTVASRLVSRIGVKPLLTGGMLSVAVGLVLFSGISGGSYVSEILPAGILTALGLGCSFVPVTIAAVAGVAPGEQGLASGLVNTSRQVGGSLGLAILATLAQSRTSAVGGPHAEALTAGFQRAFEVGAGFALAGALVAAVGLQFKGRAARRVRVAAASE